MARVAAIVSALIYGGALLVVVIATGYDDDHGFSEWSLGDAAGIIGLVVATVLIAAVSFLPLRLRGSAFRAACVAAGIVQLAVGVLLILAGVGLILIITGIADVAVAILPAKRVAGPDIG